MLATNCASMRGMASACFNVTAAFGTSANQRSLAARHTILPPMITKPRTTISGSAIRNVPTIVFQAREWPVALIRSASAAERTKGPDVDLNRSSTAETMSPNPPNNPIGMATIAGRVRRSGWVR